MDDRRFDDLTKLVGRKASRRAVIKAAIAGAIASVFGGGVAQAALSPIKTRPKTCIQPGQPCGRPGIDPSRDCCYKCNATTKKCCEDLNYVCTKDADCCVTASGVQPICRDPKAGDTDTRKTCQLPGALQPGAQCLSGSECASGNCVNGVCSACPAGTTVCGTKCCNTSQCQTCVNGQCKSKCGPCQTCDGNGNCVSTCTKCQTCSNGVCVAKTCPPCQTCNPETGLCVSTCDRCQKCSNGVCVPKCTKCQTCDPATGVCSAKPCPTCQECDPATGQCKAKVCGPCQSCSPDTGVCETTCTNCQRCSNNTCVAKCTDSCAPCNPDTGICTPTACGPCEVCNARTGQCETTCTNCQVCEGNTCVAKCPDPCSPCNPQTGACEPIDCPTCEVCEAGQCVVACPDPCAPCDAYTGECVEVVCDPCLECRDGECVESCTDLCAPCDPYTGLCAPTSCDPCYECDPYTGFCEYACGECETCDDDTGACVERDCSRYGNGICIVGLCFNDDCDYGTVEDGTNCVDPDIGDGTCCSGVCCPDSCDCYAYDGSTVCVVPPGGNCVNDAQCPPGQQCVTTNCALIACTSDDGNLLCIDGYYRARCNHCATTGCGECESCNADSGKCEPISYWEEVGCGNGGICCGGVCCDGDQCGCVSLDEDDPTQEYCTFGNAITCNSDDECFPNQYCQQSNNFCINVACETDGDCPIGIGCYIPVGSDTGYCRILCSDCRYSSSCDECFECNEDTGVCEFDCTDEEEECCPDDCACIETYPAGTACIDPNVTTNNVCSEQEPDACGAGEVCGIDDVCYAACVD